ncbi:NADH dehydrogenase FAD-containing subunit [Iocasia frigidifontis]|uniref:NADH dehydrogenase FAD-containing subunit n=1 Tax=Iocasia fonsfrigidae TaxID=2682810 RepID=A0A8A7KB48_9FIRM|nr:NADH-ubiquinone oxidoreductase-F iron-sulfur binding region domain-containing protein [Iocasia fonsfrigidae]QTL99016.1 NADH dehydrogenase FAD-containing subunit [Iocasia fonsfrigidae]
MEETLFLKKDMKKELSNYEFSNLKKALKLGREKVIDIIKQSGLKGRGGAGFPTGLKWELAYQEEADKKYIICNGDEGEPGTFKDRYLLENNPVKVLEGILIVAYAIGADEGYCYIRGEYLGPINIFEKVINEAEATGILGENILDSGFNFNLYLVKGAGAYVCGDETSLINSIEGKRGRSRIKPPYPIAKGLFDKPTVVNNVETLVSAVEIINQGLDKYLELGTENSRGTKLVCLSGDVNQPGVYEVEFGQVTLGEIIEQFGKGIRNYVPLKFLVPGGISTQVLTPAELNVPYTYEGIASAGSALGSGAVIVVDEGHDLVDLMLNVSRFFMDETCGTCFPCREGNRQVYHMLKEGKEGFTEKDVELIKNVGTTIHLAARCGLGQTSLNFIGSVFDKFGDELKLKGGEHYVTSKY